MSNFYKYKPVVISVMPSEAIDEFTKLGFKCTSTKTDNILCQKFDDNGNIIQSIVLIVSNLGEQQMIEEVQVTNYI